jgi:CubicO group peptidase (beta-lactamase class C family)
MGNGGSRLSRAGLVAVFSVVLPLLSAGSMAQNPPGDAAKAGMDPQKLARIAPRMKAFVDRGSIAGAVTLVARHGVVASLEAVGYQNLETKRPMTPDTIFQIMSMTKPVTAVALMMLVDDGKVVLGAPLETYIPEFKGLWVNDTGATDADRRQVRPVRPITLRDLLTHTSGMASGPPAGIGTLLSTMHMSLADAVLIYSQQPLNFQPGTRWQYSNPGIATVGRVIEIVSGKPFEQFLEERVFQPLGMKDSFIFPPAEKTGRIAMVYDLENGKLRKAGNDLLAGDPALFRRGARYSGPEYGMYSTALDLAAFYQMVLNGGTFNGKRLLSSQAVELMTTLHTGTIDPAGHRPGKGYGLAWTVIRDPIATLAMESIGTYGHGGAFGTEGWVDPGKDLVGVFLIQRDSGGTNEESDTFKIMAASSIVK